MKYISSVKRRFMKKGIFIQNNGISVFGIAMVGIMAVFFIGIPTQNISKEQSVQGIDIEIPAIKDLHILNSGLTSLTLKWSKPTDNKNVVTYKVYMENEIIGVLDGNVNTHNVTGLRAGGWYQFHVEACDFLDKCSKEGAVVSGMTTTLQEATEDIIGKVEELVSTGLLTPTQGGSLIKNLSSVYQLDQNNANFVISQFQDFIYNTNSLINKGVMSHEVGKSLVDATDEVIRNIKG